MFKEIVIAAPLAEAEALSDALMEAGALSVSVEDESAGTDAETPLFGEPGMPIEQSAWERSRIIALMDGKLDAQELVEHAAQTARLAVPSFELRDVADQDWVRLTQSQFDPIEITSRIWVVPSWHAAPEQAEVILELDPGLAFGTGSHPTTRLCMQWLDAHLQTGQSVLDYGCGSGILAILAKKLGSATTIGIDIDPQAIVAAFDNAQKNQVELAFGLPDQLAGMKDSKQFDVVVANILSNPLKLLASMLVSHVQPGGALVLSGVLARQADEVIAAYAPYMQLSVHDMQEGWVCLAGER